MSQSLDNKFLELRRNYIASQFGKLNDVQKQAVFYTQGPLLILAGAGSGKTTVLVNRIANLIRFEMPIRQRRRLWECLRSWWMNWNYCLQKRYSISGAGSALAERPVWPYHILAITFTNKAAGELKIDCPVCLRSRTGCSCIHLSFSMCRILRRDAERLGYPKSFTIYDTDDQQRAMKEVYKSLNVDDKFIPIKAAMSNIGRLKDKMISPKQALAAPADTRAGLIAKIYDAYQKRLLHAGAMDFDDLIYQTVRLIQECEDVREFYQSRYQYVLVDEYQDTSVAQFQLVYLLAGAHRNVCVVGDDDQSIYRFRGATIENILNFEEHFQGAKVIRLEQNYRSTSTILMRRTVLFRITRREKAKLCGQTMARAIRSFIMKQILKWRKQPTLLR